MKYSVLTYTDFQLVIATVGTVDFGFFVATGGFGSSDPTYQVTVKTTSGDILVYSGNPGVGPTAATVLTDHPGLIRTGDPVIMN